MLSFTEWRHKINEVREPAMPASELIDFHEHTEVTAHQMNRPCIEIGDDLALELKYYTNQPIEELMCSSIFNAIYQELAKSGQISEENMKKLPGQDAWINRDNMECSLLVKNKALYFMKSQHVNQEFNYEIDGFLFRLYKTNQDIASGSDEWISSCVNSNLLTRIEFKFIIRYNNAGCHIQVPEFVLVKKEPVAPKEEIKEL